MGPHWQRHHRDIRALLATRHVAAETTLSPPFRQVVKWHAFGPASRFGPAAAWRNSAPPQNKYGPPHSARAARMLPRSSVGRNGRTFERSQRLY